LRGEGETKPTGDRILERLASPQAAANAPAAMPQPADKMNRQRLEALTKSAEPTPAPAAQSQKPADLDQANQKLSALVEKPKE